MIFPYHRNNGEIINKKNPLNMIKREHPNAQATKKVSILTLRCPDRERGKCSANGDLLEADQRLSNRIFLEKKIRKKLLRFNFTRRTIY
jgi:hypothetical protein